MKTIEAVKIQFLILLLLPVTGCSHKPYLTYKQGDIFKIALPKNAMGGYVWSMEKSDKVELQGDTSLALENKETALMEYTKVFELKAMEKGRTILKFIKRRPFEPDSLQLLEGNYRDFKILIK